MSVLVVDKDLNDPTLADFILQKISRAMPAAEVRLPQTIANCRFIRQYLFDVNRPVRLYNPHLFDRAIDKHHFVANDDLAHLSTSSRMLHSNELVPYEFFAKPGIVTFQHHPAYQATRYLSRDKDPDMIEFLLRVVDYRWFIDPAKPESISRLSKFTGLTTIKKEAEHHTTFRLFSTNMPIATFGRRVKWGPYEFDNSAEGRVKMLKKILLFILLHWRSFSGRSSFDPEKFFYSDGPMIREYIKKTTGR